MSKKDNYDIEKMEEILQKANNTLNTLEASILERNKETMELLEPFFDD